MFPRLTSLPWARIKRVAKGLSGATFQLAPPFGSPAISANSLTRGFASPPHDGFAFVGKSGPRTLPELQKERAA
jgi:hypothetical protein